MDDSPNNDPLDANGFHEMRSSMDSQFREYMHARQILSTLPESTLSRHRQKSPKQSRRNKEEDMLLHRMIAALHVYQSDAVACAQSGADFASGLMAFASCEGLAIVGLIRKKTKLKQCVKYKRLWETTQESAKKSGLNLTLSRFLLRLRTNELFSLARSVNIYSEQDLPEQVIEVLRIHGFDGRLSDFVHKTRNCIHPRWNIEANEKHAKFLDVMYSLEGMKNFHAGFALCAWELHGRLVHGLQSENSKL